MNGDSLCQSSPREKKTPAGLAKSRIIKNILGFVLLAIFIVGTHYLPVKFNIHRPFILSPLNKFRVMSSYMPFMCWWLSIASIIWLAIGNVEKPMNRPKLSTLIVLAILLISMMFSGYMHTMVPKGDSADNMAYAMSVANQTVMYNPWTSLGYGKQMLPFQISAPIFWITGPVDWLPNLMLMICNGLSCVFLYAFLRGVKMHRIIALLTTGGVLYSLPLIFGQKVFFRQIFMPICFFLTFIFFHRAFQSISTKKIRPILAYSMLCGLIIGLGFNVYDLNYLFGAMIIGIFIVLMIWEWIFRKSIPFTWLLVILIIFSACVIIGIGPFLDAVIKSPGIVFARMRTGNINTQYIKSLKILLETHWNSTSTLHGIPKLFWNPKWMVFFIVPGLLLMFRKQYRHVRLCLFSCIGLLTLIFILGGPGGRRRVVSLLFFEYALIGISFDYLLRKWHQFFPTKRRWGSVVICIFMLVFMVGDNFISSRSLQKIIDRSADSPVNRATTAYHHTIKELSDRQKLCIFEPSSSKASIYWSGGRPEVYPIHVRVREQNFRKIVQRTLMDIRKSNQSFAFVFLIKDNLNTVLTHMIKFHRNRYFENIQTIEQILISELNACEFSDVQHLNFEPELGFQFTVHASL